MVQLSLFVRSVQINWSVYAEGFAVSTPVEQDNLTRKKKQKTVT